MAEKSSTKKRDSRAGMRKVTSLTAEQLERKRANDREAQRTIRARTKEHIERLEHQVADLTAKGQQVDRVLERNAALEAEIAHLRQQLAMMTSRQLYPSIYVYMYRLTGTGEDERRSSTSSNPASVISSPFNSPPMTDSLPPGPSMPPLTHRMSLPQSAWHAYVSPPPPPSSTISSVSGPDAAGETVPYHHPQHEMGYSNDAYRNLAYPPSRAHPQHMPVATLGYDSNMPSLQATHLPVPGHLQQQHQQPQHPHAYVHSPPSQAHIAYQWDSRG
ncbi:hypothetical protein UA08_08612 [Talaromyces atroroseus]|uniref:BZIP domain-containing protein n=1 Tax=Talaromyces atroroseus TaxID=1441469 RepID=A0A225ARH9_TALAT|nr:hypothetical protein UA08_08612 [Talaromyces atroroseus]OKL56057.1 hypothetical protein UA08_08612 [Talaromyces atroroseus]